MENGDEEQLFAAVERPSSNSPDDTKGGKYIAPGRRKHNQAGKLIPPTQLGSSGPPPMPRQGPLGGHHSQNNKNNNYSLATQQQHATGPYSHQAYASALHNQGPSPPSAGGQPHKLNGDVAGGPNRDNRGPGGPNERDMRDIRDMRDGRDGRDVRDLRDMNKGGPLPQRQARHYSSQPPNSGNQGPYSEPPLGNKQMSMNKGSMHMQQVPMAAAVPSPSGGPGDGQPHVGIPAHMMMQKQTGGPPPQSQRQRIARDEQTQDFRKFNQQFNLSAVNQSKAQQMSQSPGQNQTHAPPQQSPGEAPPPKHQPNAQHPVPAPAAIPSQPKHNPPAAAPAPVQPAQPPESQPPPPQQSYVSVVQQQLAKPVTVAAAAQTSTPAPAPSATASPTQSTPTPAAASPAEAAQAASNSVGTSTPTTPVAAAVTPASTPGSAAPSNDSVSSDKSSSVKKFVLNPAAKPFTPRVPVTPNSSRPHTPQTPGANNNGSNGASSSSGSFTPQPNVHPGAQMSLPPTPQPQAMQQQHVPPVQTQMMAMTYFMQPPPSTYPGPTHAQQSRFRKNQSECRTGVLVRLGGADRFSVVSVPVASQMHVAAAAAAATGQPLLAPAPIHQFVSYPQAHPQPYQQQYHTPMVSRSAPFCSVCACVAGSAWLAAPKLTFHTPTNTHFDLSLSLRAHLARPPNLCTAADPLNCMISVGPGLQAGPDVRARDAAADAAAAVLGADAAVDHPVAGAAPPTAPAVPPRAAAVAGGRSVRSDAPGAPISNGLPVDHEHQRPAAANATVRDAAAPSISISNGNAATTSSSIIQFN